jgi:tetratricopeptide (TPR) repeat protein
MRRFRSLGLAFILLSVGPVLADTPPQAAWQAYQAGQTALARENFVLAEQQFRIAIQEDRLLSLAHYGLGTTLAATRRYPEALESFQQAIATHRERLAKQAAQAGQLDQRRDQEIQELRDSIRAIESGNVKFTSSQEVIKLEQRIQQLEREKGREKTGVQATVPAEFFVALGSAHHRLGHLEEARAAYEEALKIDPARGEAHNNLAVLALARGDREGAREQVRLAEAAGFRVNPDLKRDVGLDAPAPASVAAAPAPAEGALKIEHQPLSCALVGRSPLIEARVVGPEAPASVRVRFQAQGSVYLYAVRMRAEGDRFVTRLPKPKKGLASFTYSIDATDNAAASVRTEAISVPVAASVQECPGEAPPPEREKLLVEIPVGAHERPPVPDGFSDEGVKGVGGTHIGITNVPAKLGAVVGLAAAVGGVVAARGSIYQEDTTPPNVVPTQLDLLALQPPPGSTIVAPSQRLEATFRVLVPFAVGRLMVRARYLDPRGAACMTLVDVRNNTTANEPLEITIAGPADASAFCGAQFQVRGLSVDVQADTDFTIQGMFFEVPYSVVRAAPGT